VFGDGGQDVDGEFVGVRIVGCDELHAGIHQGGDEGQIAGQAVEFGDAEFSLRRQATRAFWSSGAGIALAALDLGMLRDQPPPDRAPNANERPEDCYCSALPKGSGLCLPC
jgi:hypothetical protein